MNGNIPGFSYLITRSDEVFSNLNETYNYLFFLVKGKIRVEYNNQQNIISSGEMFFVTGKSGSSITLLNDSEVVVYAFSNKSNLCASFTDEEFKEAQGKGILIPSGLKMVNPLQHYLNLIIFYIDDNLFCEDLLKIKEQELFMIINEFYTKEQLILFFYPEISTSIDIA